MRNRPSIDDANRAAKLDLPLALQVWLVATLGASILGPFGTYTQLDFGARLFYWGTMIAVTLLLGGTLRLVVFNRFTHLPLWQRELLSVVIMAPVLAASIWRLSPILLGSQYVATVQPTHLGVYVFGIGLLGVAVRYQIFDSYFRPAAELADPPEASPRLLDRLPDEYRGEILRLSGRDHLVEVATDKGSTQIRIRFGDAIAEMEPVLGYCAHRSHWITHAAISGVEREPGRLFLRLVNGDRVPVSRKYKPGLENAGII